MVRVMARKRAGCTRVYKLRNLQLDVLYSYMYHCQCKPSPGGPSSHVSRKARYLKQMKAMNCNCSFTHLLLQQQSLCETIETMILLSAVDYVACARKMVGALYHGPIAGPCAPDCLYGRGGSGQHHQ